MEPRAVRLSVTAAGAGSSERAAATCSSNHAVSAVDMASSATAFANAARSVGSRPPASLVEDVL
eukprot:1631933-Prymnesium_polylepis.1